MTTDGEEYVVKGPEPELVFSEAVGYHLAERLDIAVPPCALVTVDPAERPLFGSLLKPSRIFLPYVESGRAVNPEVLARVIVLDIWVGNPDRNFMSVVSEPVEDDRFRLFAIDFEKSMVLRGAGTVQLATVAAQTFWPADDMGDVCAGLTRPTGTCDVISSIPEREISHLIREVHQAMDLPELPLETIEFTLMSRANRINDLVEEAWGGE